MKNLIITSVFILSGLFAQVDYEADIQPIWDNNCTSCHVYGHSSGLNLNTSGVSYNNLVDVVSQNYAPALRVATGDPGSSVLYDKISGGGTYGGVMPPSGQMTASNIALVQTWITELSQTDGLFFSEYAEGSSNNKYIEIYNGTGADVDLSDYAIVRYNNGSTTDENLFTFSATLTSGEVYVIANADADPTGILPYNDDDGTNAGVTWFNGDDYLGLIYDANGDGTFDNSSEVIDVIGLFGEDPGSGWDVAGVSTATGEHTLVRKSSVTSGNTDWSVSAGTDADNSEWIVYPQNTWDYIGSHPHVDPAIAISSPTNGATFYSPDVTVSFDVSNFDVDYVAGGGDGHIHYALDAGITVMQFTSNDIALTGLAETSHTFIIWLVDDSHANLSPHVADTVSFTVAPALTTTPIFDIQSGTVAVETIVTIKGIVTAGSGETPDGSAAFYMQEGTGQYSGINVYSTGFSVNRGDSVFVTGEYVEYYDKTEISNVTDITVISTDVTLPTAEVLTLDQTDWEPWEGVLISIQNITVADDDAGFGEWKVNIGVDTLVIDNAGNYTYSPTNGDFISSITGPLNYTYSNYKIIPRDDIDIDLTGDSPSISNIVTEPTSPTNADDVTVSASITDNGSIASAVLTYNAGAGGTDVAMTNSTGDIYTGTIPAQNAGTTVTFSITATDDEGNSSTSDETSYYVVSSGGEITAIYDIQYVSYPDADDVSPLLGQTVTISGVVTAEFWGSSYNSVFFVQDSLAPWSGIMVYTDDSWDTFDFATSSGIVHSLAEGDSVTLTGEVYEHNNKTEINNVTEVIIHGTAANEFAPMTVTVGQVMTGGSDAEAYEGCLIMVVDVSVESENPDAPNNDYGEWSVTDGTNSMRVDDTWDYYFYPEVGQSLSEIVGLLDYSLLNFKLQPRLARDVMEEDVTRIQRINQVLHSDLMKVADDNVSDMSYYMEGDTVTLEGIVTVATGLAYAGTGIKLTFEDYNGGPWSGMVCYSADPSALGTQPIGRKIRATGVISEYGHDTYDGNVTEIDIVQPIQVLGFDPTAVPVDTIHTGDLRDPLSAEQWGAVWIEINDAMVTQNDLDYGQWTIDDGTGEIKIGTNSEAEEWTDWVRPPVGAFVESIRGWVYNRHGYNSDSTAYKLEPNYPSDITFGAGPPIIAEVQRDPCVVTPSDQVQVSTMITDNSTISQAFVHFRYDGGVWDSAAMSLGADDIWQGDIPSSSSDDVFVEYYISAYDDGVDQIEIKSSHFPNIEVGNYMGYISKNGDLTIYDIQFSPWPSGVSPYIDCSVTLTGIVTVDSLDYSTGSYNSYAMQSASAQWSGIFFDGDNLPGLTRGDEITISGKVYEYYGSTNVDSVTTVSILSSNNVVSPLLVGTADLAQDSDETEAYEGCLVNVSNVTVSDANQYDWSIKDESNISCLMDDDMSTMEAVNFMFGLEIGSALETVSGIFNFSYGTYKIEVRDMADLGQLSIDNDFSGITREFALYPNFPNPFNPETRIRFQLAENSNVRLMIYDVLGRKVRMLVSDRMDAGHHVLNWDGLNDAGTAVASGMYVYRIKAGDFIAHRKMLLVR